MADDDLSKEENWRFEQLLDVGFPPQIAETIAVCLDVDLHRAVKMKLAGCDPDMVAAILL